MRGDKLGHRGFVILGSIRGWCALESSGTSSSSDNSIVVVIGIGGLAVAVAVEAAEGIEGGGLRRDL